VRVLHVGYGFRPYRHGGLIFYAEDLMDGQVRRGHQVGYFFSGRHYPVGARDVLKRWERRGVRMYEMQSPSLTFGGDSGTLTPQDDANHPPTENLFRSVLGDFHPHLVHIQELIGLPSSLIDIARAHGVPVVATLQDYLPLCPVLKLFDSENRLCLRRDVGEQCARCSAHAPAGRAQFLNMTVAYELRTKVPSPWDGRILLTAQRGMELARRLRGRNAAATEASPPPRERAPGARLYQARRDLAVERLNRVDALVAQSRRVAEIYAELGVHPDRLQVMQFTLRHLEDITPKEISRQAGRVHFATLNGCASIQKGAEVVLGALERLDEAGLGERFKLTVLGYAPDENRRRLATYPSAEYGGYYDPAELDEVLAPFDVGIVPSVWEEAYGYVGVEFLAKGIPVIGNARGGIVDYTRDAETGWVNRSANAAGLARIMAHIIQRPAQVAELNARIRANRARIIRPIEDHYAEMEKLYESVLARTAAREEALVRNAEAFNEPSAVGR
jgi:glycosyltransferase involved in cell wall biosynthesis